jgi:hypothetical protein
MRSLTTGPTMPEYSFGRTATRNEIAFDPID